VITHQGKLNNLEVSGILYKNLGNIWENKENVTENLQSLKTVISFLG